MLAYTISELCIFSPQDENDKLAKQFWLALRELDSRLQSRREKWKNITKIVSHFAE